MAERYPLISEVSSWCPALNTRSASNKIGACSAATASHMYAAANRQVDLGFRYYFLNPAVQFVTTVRGGDVAPEPPVVLMRRRLPSEVTVPFHPTRRYTAFQRQNECRRFNGDET